MKFSEVHARVGNVPFITPANARRLYDLILDQQCRDVLELGIAHGTATCYIAAALQELGRGCVTAVDLEAARQQFTPSAEQQIADLGLQSHASIVREKSGYPWFLHDEIVRCTTDDVCQPSYDLAIIDGPKNWTIDGATFFFVDKLLRRDGWIIFDDYHWTYADAESQREATDGITHRSLSEAERTTPHIREVFELLVKQHPDYGSLQVIDNCDWAIAKKDYRTEKIYSVVDQTSPLDFLKARLRQFKRSVRPAGRNAA